MSVEPVRFVHAAGLWLDCPLTGLADLPDDHPAWRLIDEAAATAFARVIDACLDRDVDFLLITGNAFDADERSLAARIALRDGFERLAEFGIGVFVQPGSADPWAAWRAIPDLPENVTLFSDDGDDAVSIVRNDKQIAAISAGPTIGAIAAHGDELGQVEPPSTKGLGNPTKAGAKSGSHRASEHGSWPSEKSPRGIGPFRVHLSGLAEPVEGFEPEADYVALSGGESRRTISLKHGLAHDPGAAQGIHAADTGARGCTLIEVDATRAVRSEFIPTTAIRREAFTVRADADMDEHRLLDQMRRALSTIAWDDSESLRIVHWTIAGSGRLFDSLSMREGRARLLHHLEPREPAPGQQDASESALVHLLHIKPIRVAAPDNAGDDWLTADLLRHLDEQGPLSSDRIARELRAAHLPNDDWAERLQTLAGDLDAEAIDAASRWIGTHCLAEEGGRP